MKFEPVAVDGAMRVDPEPRLDERGSFARVWCEREFADAGIDVTWRQANVGFSHAAGTMRGIHYQRPPDGEAKLVRCTRGRVLDVAVDLRPSSPTYRGWAAEELSDENGRMLYIPEGCGHAYLTLVDDSEILYLTSAFYAPASAHGARWDDPAFGIEWPTAPSIISDQDSGWPPWPAGREGRTT
jgi:dTDP-4-dehydrorhamnose 3,5-epimerase